MLKLTSATADHAIASRIGAIWTQSQCFVKLAVSGFTIRILEDDLRLAWKCANILTVVVLPWSGLSSQLVDDQVVVAMASTLGYFIFLFASTSALDTVSAPMARRAAFAFQEPDSVGCGHIPFAPGVGYAITIPRLPAFSAINNSHISPPFRKNRSKICPLCAA